MSRSLPPAPPAGPSRRAFLGQLGAFSLAGLVPGALPGLQPGAAAPLRPRAGAPVKRVIYLHMAGSPSQLDLFQPKPYLVEHDGEDIPAEFTANERFAFIKGTPKLLGSPYAFAQHGDSGHWFSELLPEMAKQADKLAFLHAIHTDQFNHAPAQIFLNTGHARIGRPSLGAWLSYGLGTENPNLPAFVVMMSGQFGPSGGAACWSSGFLPTVHQGVRLRGQGDPVLYLSEPGGVDRAARRRSLDALGELNRLGHERHQDPETLTRIEQYELAYRMQEVMPELADLGSESAETLARYGAVPGEASYANNCLLARRMSEAGVRFIHLYDWGWDSHGTNPGDDIITSLPRQCRRTDRATAALLADLEQRGLLDETLVVWGGEFGRTPMNERRNGSTFLGRDHHPHAFSMWLAGAGIRGGASLGATDELGYFPTEGRVGVHDLHATMLHLMGIDHEQLTYRFQGRDFRLTDVAGERIGAILA